MAMAFVALVLLVLGTGALALIRAYWPLPSPSSLALGERTPVGVGAEQAAAPGRPGLPGAPPDRPGPAGAGPGPRNAAARWRLAGMIVGAVGALIAMRTPDLGRGALLAAPVFGLGVFAGALTGELTRRLPTGEVRRAGLRVRRTIDYLPPTLSVIVALSTVVLAVLATATTRTGSPDDQGRAGRVLTCGTSTYGPWPGSYYTVPTLAVILAGLAVAAFTLRRVVRRPQPADQAVTDDAARRRSAEVIVAATGILVLVPLFGIALFAGMTLNGFCEAQWWEGSAVTVSTLSFAAFATAAWCGACLLLPAKRARA